jgi:hypothetical protein
MYSRVFLARAGLRSALVATLLCFVPAPLFADGLDLGWLLRVPMMEFHSAAYITAVILAVMFANYILNFLVIGVPAILWGGAPCSTGGYRSYCSDHLGPGGRPSRCRFGIAEWDRG